MKCLISAVGKGSRQPNKAPGKLLVPILGVPLNEGVVRTGIVAGADEVLVGADHNA